MRYSQGLYGPPGTVSLEELVQAIDSCAYVTGQWVLFAANHVNQRPTTINCFTMRRHNRSRERLTPFGRIVFTTAREPVYKRPAEGAVASPERALCDLAFLCLRSGLLPASLITFRDLGRLSQDSLHQQLADYPQTVGRAVWDLVAL